MAHDTLNQGELEMVHQLLSAALVEANKLKTYEDDCHDKELKSWLQGEQKIARATVAQLMRLLDR